MKKGRAVGSVSLGFLSPFALGNPTNALNETGARWKIHQALKGSEVKRNLEEDWSGGVRRYERKAKAEETMGVRKTKKTKK